MNLPLVIDIALGLVFIYLILSLLASEIQEIVGTLLQWRAEHLKLSIEVLLSGNNRSSEAAAQELADILYDSPWIKGLNQEAKGQIARAFRAISHLVGRAYRFVTGTRNVFGRKRTSGPSYIPSEAFAASVMERLQIGDIWQLLVEDRLRQYVEAKMLQPVNQVLNDLKASSGNEFLLSGERQQLEQSVDEILQDFRTGYTKLSESFDRLIARLDEFAVVAQEVLPDSHHLTDTFMRRLDYIRRGVASSEMERATLLKSLRPRLDELLSVFDDGSVTYQELQVLARRYGGPTQQLIDRIKATKVVTPELRNSLLAISQRVETQVDAADEMVQAFSRGVESWFDRGMERATGVYRRNARAVALIIGIAVAISINADSFHIATRLARDPAVRNTITQTAQQFATDPNYVGPQGNLQADLETVQTAVDETLETLPFPLGYNAVVVQQQQLAEETWRVPLIPRRLLGWIISGFAISMGANFWFDLLKKVISVRSSGPKEGAER